MTEVRTSSSGGHLGLFATKDYDVGDVILEEECPLIRLAVASPSNNDDDDDDNDKKMNSEETMMEKEILSATKIEPPESVSAVHQGTYKGMIKNGLIWMFQNESIESTKKESLLKLYHPSNTKHADPEKRIVDLSRDAVTQLKEYVGNSSDSVLKNFEAFDTLQKVILIWACNSFQGGRIYGEISRVNHSCNPNAVIQTMDGGEGQRLIAATKINKGSEVCISYLGLLLYADTATRKQKLLNTKYFDCQCTRCKETIESGSDKSVKIPCPTCHPRESPQMALDEDVQYDDEQTVQYVSICSVCDKCKNVPEQGSKLQKIHQSICNKIQSFLDTYESLTKNKEEERWR